MFGATLRVAPCATLMPAISMKGARIVLLGAVLLATGVLLHARFGNYHVFSPGVHAVGLDDAYISFRYAVSLSQGDGLVYNPGERVEGFSNLLYTLLIGGLALFVSPQHLYTAALGLNIGFAIASMALIHATLRRRDGPAAAMLGVLLFALTPAIWIWTGAGLETALFLLCIIGAWSAADDETERGEWTLAAWCAALVLVRIDGFLTALLVIAWLLVTGRRTALGRVGAATILTIAAVTSWRLWYYGYPLSNTYYAKYDGALRDRLRSSWDGLRIIVRHCNFWLYGIVLVLAFMTTLGQAFANRARVAQVLWLELAIALAMGLYYFHIGGDELGDRFLLPATAMAVLILARAVARLARPLRAYAAAAAIAGSLLAIPVDPRFEPRRDKYDFLIEFGRWLKANHGGETLAIATAGKTPFFSGLPTLDILGLTDAHVAHSPVRVFRVGHSKYDPDYVFSRRPGILVTTVDGALEGAWGIARSRYEREGYSLRYLVNSSTERLSENVVDVGGWPEARTRALIASGFELGVLLREGR